MRRAGRTTRRSARRARRTRRATPRARARRPLTLASAGPRVHAKLWAMAFPATRCGCVRPACRGPRARDRAVGRAPRSIRCSWSPAASAARRSPSLPGIDHLLDRRRGRGGWQRRRAGIPAVLLFGLPPRRTRRAPAPGTTRGRPARHAGDQGRPPDLLGHHRPVPVRVHIARPLRRAARRRRRRQRPTLELLARTARLAGRGGRRRRRAERHDGRARRRLRAALDDHGLSETPLIAYSASSRPPSTARSASRRSAPRTGDRGLPDGPRQRARGRARGQARRRRGRRHPDGQARAAVPRRDPPRQGRDRHARSPPTTSAASTR